MLFNSPVYLFLFLPLVLLGFWTISRSVSHKAAALWLALCSLFFYGWWDSRYIALLLGSIVFNYSMGIAIDRVRAAGFSKRVLTLGVISNLCVLGWFKYMDFFLDTVNQVAGTTLPLPHIVLPLGISFFTFTQIAFLVDVYRGQVKEYSPIHYLLFVTYFPHLIAGPILHHRDMMPQFASNLPYSPKWRNLGLGLFIFSVGLFKKTVLADSLTPYANAVFSVADAGGSVSCVQAWEGTIAFTLQLYFDFSGYIDMAVGSSKMLGIDLPVNFNSPFKATNISEYWRRWHMTLGRFLRDYVYIPLGGSRKGPHRKQLNIATVMLLSGLWHGADWTFIIWGAMHAVMLVTNNYWQLFREQVLGHDLAERTWPGTAVAIFLTLLCVLFTRVLFRAKTVGGAGVMLQAMVSPEWSRVLAELANRQTVFAAFFGLLMILWCLPNTHQIATGKHTLAWKPTAFWLGLGVIFLSAGSWLMVYGVNRVNAFVYFQF